MLQPSAAAIAGAILVLAVLAGIATILYLELTYEGPKGPAGDQGPQGLGEPAPTSDRLTVTVDADGFTSATPTVAFGLDAETGVLQGSFVLTVTQATVAQTPTALFHLAVPGPAPRMIGTLYNQTQEVLGALLLDNELDATRNVFAITASVWNPQDRVNVSCLTVVPLSV